MTGSYNEPFDDCDVFVPRLEDHDPAAPDVFANGKGQKAVQALFPDLLIAWRLPESLGFVPSGWLWAQWQRLSPDRGQGRIDLHDSR